MNEMTYFLYGRQIGVLSYDEMESLVKFYPRLYITSFLHSMDLAYAAADLIISRAGMPSPVVAEGHQFPNACLMANLANSKIPSPDMAEGHQFNNACLMVDLADSRMPSPDVAEGHQFHNACLMADLADSRVITADELDSLTPKKLLKKC